MRHATKWPAILRVFSFERAISSEHKCTIYIFFIKVMTLETRFKSSPSQTAIELLESNLHVNKSYINVLIEQRPQPGLI